MINLLSPELKKARRFAKLNVLLIEYVILIAIAITGMIALLFYGESTLNATKATLEESIADDEARALELEPISKEASELSGTVNTIGTLLDQEVKFSYVLQEIGSIIPPGVILSGLTLSQDTSKPILLEANLTSYEKAGVFQQNLIESDLFIGADVISVTQGTVTGYGFRAQIQAYFNPEVPLNSLDDPVEEEEVVEESEVEESQIQDSEDLAP